MPKHKLRNALFDQILAQPVAVRVRSAIAMIDDPRRSVRGLLEPVLDSVVRELEDPIERAENERALMDKAAIDGGRVRKDPFTFDAPPCGYDAACERDRQVHMRGAPNYGGLTKQPHAEGAQRR